MSTDELLDQEEVPIDKLSADEIREKSFFDTVVPEDGQPPPSGKTN